MNTHTHTHTYSTHKMKATHYATLNEGSPDCALALFTVTSETGGRVTFYEVLF